MAKNTNAKQAKRLQYMREYLLGGNSPWPKENAKHTMSDGTEYNIGKAFANMRHHIKKGIIKNLEPYEKLAKEIGVNFYDSKPKPIKVASFGKTQMAKNIKARKDGYLLDSNGKKIKPALRHDFFEILAEVEKTQGLDNIFQSTTIMWDGKPYPIGKKLKRIKDAYNAEDDKISTELIELMREKGYDIGKMLLGSGKPVSKEVRMADLMVVAFFAARGIKAKIYHDYILANGQKADCFCYLDKAFKGIEEFMYELDSLHHYDGATAAKYAYKNGCRTVEEATTYAYGIRNADIKKDEFCKKYGIYLIRAKTVEEFEVEFELFTEEPNRYLKRHNWSSQQYYGEIEDFAASTAEALPNVIQHEAMKHRNKVSNGYFIAKDARLATARANFAAAAIK